ncbi:MAG: shikimate dehydrogenase [Solirubrobacterales bacterium]|nr:shikimate dehydrogenase [Solirubrobacterales bacterium]
MRSRTSDIAITVGLIGADIGPSLSPALHEHEAHRLGIPYAYERIDVAELGVGEGRVGELVRAARRLGFRGLNVTHPCKRAVTADLTDLSGDAIKLGAVNTIVFTDGRAIGHNTDWPGFERSFERGLPDVARRRAVLIGAGGAGAAVAHAALSLGIEHLSVHDRRPQAARDLVAALQRSFGGDRATVCEDVADGCRRADGLIHATPTGMVTHPGLPVDAAVLREDLWVAEIVYRPLETELLRSARRAGCRTLDGGGMAVIQAALSFELFTGVSPDLDRMLAHFAALSAPEAS